MIEVQMEFKREHDGSVIVRYNRSNGTQTWERHKGGRAIYFPAHDILHYCVETVLKLQCGFYGLIAQGWDIREMDGKHDRGRLPADSILVEQLVGLFSTEGVNGSPTAAEEINAQMEAYAERAGTIPLRPFSEGELAGVRSSIAQLTEKWTALPIGQSLHLSFQL